MFGDSLGIRVTILDDDVAELVTITPRADTVDEGSDVIFDVTSTRDASSSTTPLNLTYSYVQPYNTTHTNNPVTTIPAGSNATTITIRSTSLGRDPAHNTYNEPDRTLIVSLQSDSNDPPMFAVGLPAEVTILDDDPPVVSIAASGGVTSVMEGELVTVDVTVSPVPQLGNLFIPLTFTAMTDDGGTYTFHEFATIRGDWTGEMAPTSYTTTGSFRVGVDNVPGTMDTVTVSIPNPPTGANWQKSATPSETSVVFNVTEGTPATPLVIKAEGVDASEGSNLTFVITLEARDPAQQVTVGYHTVNPIRQSRNPAHLEALLRDWEAAGEPRALPYRVGRHTADFATNSAWILFDTTETTKTITVPINQDINAEPDEFVFLRGGGALWQPACRAGLPLVEFRTQFRRPFYHSAALR